LYVQTVSQWFYFSSSCPQDDERSEESCGHDGRPKTGRGLAFQGRRGAWFKPTLCRKARTAE
jgi:hypothetical protein